MKTRYILYPLLTFLAMLLPTSCSFEEDIMEDSSIISHGDKVSFTMEVSLAGTSGVESRAFTDTKTDELANLHLVVFEQGTGGYYYYKESAPATLKSSKETDGDECWLYDVTLTYTSKPCRVHLVGNYGETLPVGFGEEGQVMGLLETQAVEGGHDVYWNFVTLPDGIDKATGSSTLGLLQHVRLVRNYVKVQLAPDPTLTKGVTLTSGATFKLTGYALYNEPTKGRVAPYNASSNGEKFASFVGDTGELLAYNDMSYKGNEPSGDFLKTYKDDLSDLVWKAPGEVSYLYERNHTNTDKPTSLIIEGDWTENGQTTSTYYKLDFVYTNSGETVYYNLLRNFVYTMNVTGVSGPGFTTAKDAVLQPAANNIAASAIAENYTNVSDGTGQLFVSTTYVLFSKNNMSVDLFYKYVPDITNPQNSRNSYNYFGNTAPEGFNGVTITATYEEETSATDPKTYSVLKERSIATSDETSGDYSGWRKMTLKNNNLYPGEAPTQNIIFVAGGLQRTVKLVLRDYGALGVATTNVLPVAKSPLKVTITIPQGIDPSLFPLRLFISSPNNTIYPDYDTNMPAESKNGKYGFIREVTYDEYRENNVITCDFLTNRAITSVTDANVNDRKVIVENEYLTQGTSTFGVGSGVLLGSSIKVNIEKIWGRFPQNIYNDGANDGTEQDVKVYKMNDGVRGEQIGTISINKSNVTRSLALISGNNGLEANSVLVFEFTDKYWHGEWSTTPITYRATAQLSDITDGYTLNFDPVQGTEINNLTSITIPVGLSVEIEPEYKEDTYTMQYGNRTYEIDVNTNVYPKNINNTTNNRVGRNDGTETVTVSCQGVNKEITINRNQVSVGNVTFDKDDFTDFIGFDDETDLTFTFTDNYCSNATYTSSGYNNGYWTVTWSSNTVAYTATCKVGDLLYGDVTLEFKRQQ